jgi:glycosyltransferase
MEKNKISIITVVKNGMPFLKTSIKSFRMQNYINKELIIVFAHSEDGTEEYLNKINDENIIIKKDITSKTKFGSINLGIELSSGKYFGLLHADDVFYDENTLIDISNAFKENINCVYGNVLFTNKNNLTSVNRIWKSKQFKRKNLKFGWMPPHTSLFLEKNFCLTQGIIYNELYPISGDYYFILKILNDSKIKTCFIDKYITVMRDGGDSTKLSNILQKLIEDIKIAKLFYSSYLICIFLKIIQKIFQKKIVNKKIKNSYLNDLEKELN